MATRKLKPTSPGQRFQTVSDFAEITRTTPEKSLTKGLTKKAGRNNNGRITARRRGGGQTNKEVGNIELAAEVFEVEVRPEVLQLVVRAQLAARRAGTHATKNRAKITGGGRKPWRQKGTGRARAGSVRSPLWRGGATIFGPQPRDYSFKVNKKVRALALKMALSSRLSEDKLKVVNTIDLPEIKTKGFVAVANELGVDRALIVVKDANENLIKSAANVQGVKVIDADKINVYDVLKFPELVMFEGAAQAIEARLK